MQDDLKERLRRIVKKPYSARRGPPPCELQMLDRIAALEAKLAKKDALLRECGEALEGLATKLTEIFDHPEYEAVFLTAQIRRGPYLGPNCAEELATAIDTLARAKENPNAG